MLPTMSITAIVENDTIKLPIHVPDGTSVEILLPGMSEGPRRRENSRKWMLEFAGSVDGLPEDFAAEHDHYIRGMPKHAGQ